MAIEEPILTLNEWMWPSLAHGYGAALNFLFVMIGLGLVGFAIAYLTSALRYGAVEAFFRVWHVVFDAILNDLVNFSLRRTLAIARLAVQEAIRRKVVVAFVVFIVILLFAGWFLDVENDHPARLYLVFVQDWTNFLLVLLALFISTFSLPTDLKNKTIYTVVTKPVRAGELILGRVIGFGIVGTVLLIATALVSYVFVIRGLKHEHVVQVDELTRVTSPDDRSKEIGKTGRTSRNMYHRHSVTLGPDGSGTTDLQKGHRHSIRAIDDGQGGKRYEVGPHEGMLLARVPRYGKLRFLDRQGNSGKGISVGNEWEYRSYIDGGTLAAAIWTFEGISAEEFPDGLTLETNFGVFRTHKGNIEEPVMGSFAVMATNPKGEVNRSEKRRFKSVEFGVGELTIPRKLKGIDRQDHSRDVDLFQDLVHNGRLEIRIQCEDYGQYFGMAEPDLFVRLPERSFAQNFAKGHVAIWLQVLMMISLGVMFSTFLSSPVAVAATVGTVVISLFKTDLAKWIRDQEDGGGPIESLIRIVTQTNMMIDLEIGKFLNSTIKFVDDVFLRAMELFALGLPNVRGFDTSRFVAYGYDIHADLLTQQLLVGFAFVMVTSLIGYFVWKTREIAAA